MPESLISAILQGMLRTGLNYFALYASFGVLVPYLQVLLRGNRFSASQIGILLGAFEVIGVIGPLFLGRLADNRGWYRRILIITIVVSATAFSMLHFFPSFIPSLVIIAVLGFFYKTTVPMQEALAIRQLPDPERDYGRSRLMGSLGFITISLFILLSGILEDSQPERIVALFSVLSAVYLGVVFLQKEIAVEAGHHRGKLSLRAVHEFPALFWTGIAVIFLGRTGLSAYYSFFSLYLTEEAALPNISFFWAIGPLSEIPVLFLGDRLMRRFSLKTLFGVALVGIALRLFLYAAFPVFPVILAAQLLHAVTFGVFHLCSIRLIQKFVREEQKALGMAVYAAIGVGLSGFIGSAFGGYIIDAWGYRVLFALYSACALTGFIPLLFFRSRRGTASKRHQEGD